jgi:hypothetical protein
VRVDDDREAELETATPFKEFQLFVTAEPSAAAEAPTGERLLVANIDG